MPAIVVDPGKYQNVRVRGADGKARSTRDRGDPVAVALRGASMDELRAVSAENGFGEKFNTLFARTQQQREDGSGKPVLNPGQVRMLMGQSFRTKLKTDGKFLVGGREVTDDESAKAVADQRAATASGPKRPDDQVGENNEGTGGQGGASDSTDEDPKDLDEGEDGDEDEQV